MGLHVVATPIGNDSDLSPRAHEILKKADFIIGEDKKPTTGLLKTHGLTPKKIRLLNEHSSPEDLKELVELCKHHTIALISDCGTPGFCDPGADLVRLCREKHIAVKSVPGPSSLSCFLSICGYRLDQFTFLGFLPQKNPLRSQALKSIKNSPLPILLMDTPYRLERLLDEVNQFLPHFKLVLGVELSKENEKVFEGSASQIKSQLTQTKMEFMLLLLPLNNKKYFKL